MLTCFLLLCCHYGFFRSGKRFLLAIAFLSSSLFSLFPSLAFLVSLSFCLPFFFSFPGTLLSVFLSCYPLQFLPWYILFPFIWLSLAFSFFPSMFILLTIIFLYIAFYGYSVQYYII